MKVVAVGGCGEMGRFAVHGSLALDFVEEILVVDLDGARARSFADLDDRLRAEQADVRDLDRLYSLFETADVVLATVGPYYAFGTQILRVAIEAGCHYIDICDDWETTLEQFELGNEANAAGLTAIIGAGASPGISNMLARQAMRELDHVDTVLTGWGSGDSESNSEQRSDSGGGAAIDHLVQQTSGQIRLRQDGNWCNARPLQERIVDYPGIGPVAAFTLGHPEPITFPRYFPEIRESANLVDLAPSVISLLRSIAGRVDRAEITISEGARYLERVERGRMSSGELLRDGSRMLVCELAGKLRKRKTLPGLFGFASGTSAGQRLSIGARLDGKIPGGMGAMTGIPVAIVLDMLGSGEIKETGVLSPEGCLDPDLFFARLEPFVEREPDSTGPLVRVTKC